MEVALVQQGVWHMSKESMPLAAGYLVASIRGTPDLQQSCRARIHNFAGDESALGMVVALLRSGVPDVIGFSVLGWNIKQFAAVCETLKQVRPDIVTVFGGNHVAKQAEQVFRRFPAVDVVVNGEGEPTMVGLLRALRAGADLGEVRGISFDDPARGVVTTPDEPRLADLDTIPSPVLSGAIPLLDDNGEFRYDVALMETNRGCPYHCSFCYWGGAVGQRVRSFSRERLRSELVALARAGAGTVVLCDANFGMLQQDAEFVEDVISVRREFGRPTALETSWAKNKSAIFYDIVRMMKDEGMQSSFTLALQTLDDSALQTMNRRNMRINSWRELATWLKEHDLDAYAELIWGAPGETAESFLRGYDELAGHVARIAAYPLLILPNTDYADRRDHYGLVTVRGDRDDFEYVLASKDVSLEENLRMQRFLFFARLLAENLVLRDTWAVLRAVPRITQSRAILSFIDQVERENTPEAAMLVTAAARSMADPDSLAPALEFCFTSSAFDDLVHRWWQSAIEPELPERWVAALRECVRYDLDARPLPDPAERDMQDGDVVETGGERFWVVHRSYSVDVVRLAELARTDRLQRPPAAGDHVVRLAYRMGFADHARSTNHEETAHFVARAAVQGDSLSTA